jgi:NAD(P)-dependent dehydrogenase (short-subunit alcohol dehydrogenase family)
MPRGGSVVLNTSWLNAVGTPGFIALSASKAASRSLALTLGAELAPKGIRVNAVCPGPINTPVYGKMGLPADQLQAIAGQIQGQVPMGRFGEADEIANAVLFLASDESSFMLGAEVVVDGGLSLL